MHVAGHTPEADLSPAPDADLLRVGSEDLLAAWRVLNDESERIDLVAVGSPHASLSEMRRLADLLEGRRLHPGVDLVVTAGCDVLRRARGESTAAELERAGVRLAADLCWCSITEPVLPERARILMTNSAKYAHYAQGLTGRRVRFGSLSDCVAAAATGRAPSGAPPWRHT